MPKKVIITCAVAGSIHTPTMLPLLPLTSDEVARDSIAAPVANGACYPWHGAGYNGLGCAGTPISTPY